jgi:serine/threonine protein kinase/uncharacterized RDD family membrane protein YckC
VAPSSLRTVDLSAGILGPYRELTPLRSWRFGTIYRGIHPLLSRLVLLRVLAPEHNQPERREQFLAEARAAATIDHPNVETRIFEAGSCGDIVFVAQEESASEPLGGFGPGTKAEHWKRPFHASAALAQALRQAAKGLQAIHAAGLTHGHLTPASLRRSSHGDVFIAGLGEPMPAEEADRPAPAIKATRQDVYDLAAAFVELVTGQALPTPAARRPKELVRHLRRVNPDISPALVRILGRCLQPDISRGLRDTAALVKAVDPYAHRQFKPAGWGNRLGSILYDLLSTYFVCGVFAFGLAAIAESLDSSLRGLLVFAGLLTSVILATGMEVAFSWTPGRRLRGLWLADASGNPPSRWRVLVRSLLRFATLSLGILLGFVPLALLDSWGPSELALLGVGVIVPLALALLYLPGRWTPTGWPLHDYLTGVTWWELARDEAGPVFDAPTALRSRASGRDSTHGTGAVPPLEAARLDQYELQKLLGQGGMGAVYLAHDTTLNRAVALKLLTAAHQANEPYTRRFEREARLAAQLSHPHVARVYGVGQADGKPYLVMEYIPGETLQQRVERLGPLPVAKAWNYIRQAAQALQAADRLSIVHRDIKPSNLMLTADEVVKVTDFGISRSFVEGEEQGNVPVLSSGLGDGKLTRTGSLLGTPMYMSPEQARAEKLDARSDIYSLGMTLYFLLAGRPPFDSSDMFDLVARQCTHEPPPLAGEVPDLSSEQAAALRRMIAKDREQRYPNYEELLADLGRTAPQQRVLANLSTRFGALWVDGMLLLILSILEMIFALPPALEHFRQLRQRESIAGATAVGLLATPNGLGLFPATATMALRTIQPVPELNGLKLATPIVTLLIFVVGIGCFGTTPGKWLFRLRVLRPAGRRVGIGRAFLRLAVLYPSLVLIWGLQLLPLPGVIASYRWLDFSFLGMFANMTLMLVSAVMIAFTHPRRGLHDWAAGTVVVRLPKKKRHRRPTGGQNS